MSSPDQKRSARLRELWQLFRRGEITAATLISEQDRAISRWPLTDASLYR